MRLPLPPVLLLSALLLYACGLVDGGKPKPGYHGPYPSGPAQSALADIEGMVFMDETGAFGGGALAIEGFAVMPNPATGKGPVVSLVEAGVDPGPLQIGGAQGQDGRWWLPVRTDGDVADLIQRVTGTPATGLSGELSEEYRATIGP